MADQATQTVQTTGVATEPQSANGAGTQNTQTGAEGAVQNFDDILKNKDYQSEFDRRVAKAIETAKGKWQEDFNSTLENKIAEAQKLAKMTAEEKAKFEKDKAEKELQTRIAEVTRRELKAEAKEQLQNDGFPAELAESLIYTDAESCKKSLEAVKIAFNAAVEKAVNDKLKGSVPKAGKGAVDFDSMTDEEYYNFIRKQE